MKPAVSIAAAVLLLTFAASAFASPGSGAAGAAPSGSPPLPRHGMSAPLPADTLVPGGPQHVPLATLIASLNQADSIQVGRVAIVWRDTVDAAGAKTQFPYTQREVMTRMRPSWLRRFTRALLNDSTALSDQLCPPPSQLPDGAQPWMTTVLWFSTKSRGQVYLNFFGNCGFAGVGGRVPAGFWIDENADSLLGMMREALPADSVLRDYRAARRLAMAAGGGEVLPKFGEYVQVDSLPVPLTRVQPEYPAEARKAGTQGTVLVQALVGRDGQVKDMRLVTRVEGLDAAALMAVRQWKFRPAIFGGKPVAVWVAVPVKFELH
ncbi:MAG: energy transducer TonB [Candidatus Eisenbacteria bacterium]|nr:energy transducer TonB [Candidatus Eisenbacteria bacterium]